MHGGSNPNRPISTGPEISLPYGRLPLQTVISGLVGIGLMGFIILSKAPGDDCTMRSDSIDTIEPVIIEVMYISRL